MASTGFRGSGGWCLNNPALGTRRITAVYSADGDFAAATSAKLSETIVAAPLQAPAAGSRAVRAVARPSADTGLSAAVSAPADAALRAW